jgi:NTE family protein
MKNPCHARNSVEWLARRPLHIFLSLWLLLVAACAHYPVNPKLEHVDPATQLRPRPEPPTRHTDLLLIVSISGGGTRAAAFGYGVLQALDKVLIPLPGTASQEGQTVTRHSLFDEIDLVGGVSGGSITAGYAALKGRGMFEDYRERFLLQNGTWQLIRRLLNPINLFRLSSPYFNRSDLEAEYFDDILFDGATFKDLDPSGPDLWIQATDIIDGHYFPFSRMHFAMLCSDRDRFPLSRAVAASASYPGPFGAITLRNYAGECGHHPIPMLDRILNEKNRSSRAFRLGEQLHTYLRWKDKPYVHLVDGGISDNLGVRGYLDYFASVEDIESLLREGGLNRVSRIAFIVVNAETKQETKYWSLLEEAPGFTNIQDVAFSAMISSYNFETLELLRRLVKDWSSTRQASTNASPIDYYAIDVGFQALPDQAEREAFLNLPTRFDLPEETINRLTTVAHRILYDSPEFQRLVRDMGGTDSLPHDMAP